MVVRCRVAIVRKTVWLPSGTIPAVFRDGFRFCSVCMMCQSRISVGGNVEKKPSTRSAEPQARRRLPKAQAQAAAPAEEVEEVGSEADVEKR